MTNPYLIGRPALVSFSGGRTSAYMLAQILAAFGGRLPDDVHVTFANTGKERPETLRFVHEVGLRWRVPIRWLEWRGGEKGGVTEVGFNSASRAGEPFDELIASKRALPNWQARWCTGFLKVEAMIGFMTALGHAPGSYAEAIGLRADEPRRFEDMVARNVTRGRRCVAPLHTAGVTKADVIRFWLGAAGALPQGFDLGLRDGEGNCDLCFLKGQALKRALIAADPTIAEPWAAWERGAGATFDRRVSVARLAQQAAAGHIGRARRGDFDVECGLMCDGQEKPQ